MIQSIYIYNVSHLSYKLKSGIQKHQTEFGLSSMPGHYPPTQNVSVQKQRGEVSVFFQRNLEAEVYEGLLCYTHDKHPW